MIGVDSTTPAVGWTVHVGAVARTRRDGDSAAAESWFSTLEWELFRKRHFDTKPTARWEVARFIDGYNRSAGTARAR